MAGRLLAFIILTLSERTKRQSRVETISNPNILTIQNPTGPRKRASSTSEQPSRAAARSQRSRSFNAALVVGDLVYYKLIFMYVFKFNIQANERE